MNRWNEKKNKYFFISFRFASLLDFEQTKKNWTKFGCCKKITFEIARLSKKNERKPVRARVREWNVVENINKNLLINLNSNTNSVPETKQKKQNKTNKPNPAKDVLDKLQKHSIENILRFFFIVDVRLLRDVFENKTKQKTRLMGCYYLMLFIHIKHFFIHHFFFFLMIFFSAE